MKKIEAEAKVFFIDVGTSHDWTHVERVRNLALRIGKKEGGDLSVLEIAAYLHDIGRRDELKTKRKFCHAEHGAKLARKILLKYGIRGDRLENILHCIGTHRISTGNKPETIEAMCLFDADKLDSIGAVGVARSFLFAGHSAADVLYTGREKEIARSGKNYSLTDEDTTILEWEVKLRYVKNKMLTATGKKIAEKRHDYMKGFFKEFWLEVEGKK